VDEGSTCAPVLQRYSFVVLVLICSLFSLSSNAQTAHLLTEVDWDRQTDPADLPAEAPCKYGRGRTFPATDASRVTLLGQVNHITTP